MEAAWINLATSAANGFSFPSALLSAHVIAMIALLRSLRECARYETIGLIKSVGASCILVPAKAKATPITTPRIQRMRRALVRDVSLRRIRRFRKTDRMDMEVFSPRRSKLGGKRMLDFSQLYFAPLRLRLSIRSGSPCELTRSRTHLLRFVLFGKLIRASVILRVIIIIVPNPRA